MPSSRIAPTVAGVTSFARRPATPAVRAERTGMRTVNVAPSPGPGLSA
jgi:hypothetical protein